VTRHDTRKLSPEAQEQLRDRAACAVGEEGKPRIEASRTFFPGRTTVHEACKKCLAGGEKALPSKPRGRPRKNALKRHQAATVGNLIRDKGPDQL
jgi:transposase